MDYTAGKELAFNLANPGSLPDTPYCLLSSPGVIPRFRDRSQPWALLGTVPKQNKNPTMIQNLLQKRD